MTSPCTLARQLNERLVVAVNLRWDKLRTRGAGVHSENLMANIDGDMKKGRNQKLKRK